MTRLMIGLPPIMLGVMTGFFYAFSVCVMPGLNQITSGGAIEAMQAINEAVQNPVFFITFFLPPLITLGCALALWVTGAHSTAIVMATAAMVYLVGVVAVTASINVPMNNALALIDPAAADTASIWAQYTQRWTFWNTIRTLANLLAFAIAALAPVMTLR